MKLLLTILLIFILFIKINAQQEKIISLTYSPQTNDIGLMYISKIKTNIYRPISLYLSTEYGYYKKLNIHLFREVIGFSTKIYETVNISGGISVNLYNYEKQQFKNIVYIKPVSFEIAITTRIKEIKGLYLTLAGDPLNYHFKFGLGLNLTKKNNYDNN